MATLPSSSVVWPQFQTSQFLSHQDGVVVPDLPSFTRPLSRTFVSIPACHHFGLPIQPNFYFIQVPPPPLNENGSTDLNQREGKTGMRAKVAKKRERRWHRERGRERGRKRERERERETETETERERERGNKQRPDPRKSERRLNRNPRETCKKEGRHHA
ncbi:hypothetical protein IE53DRAFT_4151 [Violaceomyces palustris]|uniref:Uncharacterized protein n=1 Tax=Violaceomyces palustris TaxID=1673888 RepID=A0ACD0P2M6_9BASI|nr:hypothetical protein IE53DRAFT_4151 [Violaceomyces palustris]